MNYETEFFLKAEKERRMLDMLFKVIYKSQDYTYQHSPSEEKYTFDSSVIRFENNKLLDTHIYEAKIRDVSYDTILLERKKLIAIRKCSKSFQNGPEPVLQYYVSTHPDGTWVFDLSKVGKRKWDLEYHNISTTQNVFGKGLKEITYLNKEDGVFYDIKTSDLKEVKIEPIKEVQKIKGFIL